MTTGRIIKRNGKWAYVLSLPPDPETGKYPQKWRSGFATKREADAAMRAALADHDEGHAPRDMTVQEYLQMWLDKGVATSRAPRTLDIYRWCCDRVVDSCGEVPLQKLEAHHIERLYADLGCRVASSTVHSVHRTLRAALNRAVKWGYLKTSPLARADAPSLRIARRETLSAEDALRVLAWLKGRHTVSYVGAYLAVYIGMRRGEIAGLRWSDVDWNECVVQVSRSRQRVKRTDLVGAPKTPQSTRELPLSDDVMDMLRTWRETHQWHTRQRQEAWADDVYILRHLTGESYDPNTLTHDLRKAEVALDLPHVSFHDLRHTYATLLLEAGVPLKTVSDLLGHSTIRLTGDVYAHVTRRMRRDAATVMENTLRNRTEK